MKRRLVPSTFDLRPSTCVVVLALVGLFAGCRSVRVLSTDQPVIFSGVSYDEAWEATLSALEEHFPIYTARKQSGDILTQFEITYGLFEFWRDPSLTPRDRWENTVQTIRRRARATVVAVSDSDVKVSLAVEKERRDRAREGARFSFASSASIFDPRVSALDRQLRDPTAEEWAALGRDTRFEAYLLDKIKKRVFGL